MPVSLGAVLEGRERRAAHQASLWAAFRLPLLSLTLVSPGPIKDSPGRRRLMDMAEIAFMDLLRSKGLLVRHRARVDGPTGPEALWTVAAPPARLKRLAIQIEDKKPWGRLLDADVLVGRPQGLAPLERRELGFADRRCLVCGEAAKVCLGLRRHAPAEAAEVASALISRFAGLS